LSVTTLKIDKTESQLMRKHKYFLDLNDLQYKQVRHSLEKKLLHALLWFSGTVLLTVFYISIFHSLFGSPKEAVLNQQIDNIKLRYSIASRSIERSMSEIKSLRMSDDMRYRPVLSMDTLPESYRNPGFGGVDRFEDINGYTTSSLMKGMRTKIEEMKNMVAVQSESFQTIGDRANEWKIEIDHMPAISPVDPTFRLGDGYHFRDVHPVLGTGRMHYGQDFCVPYGTKVYATGDGKVIESDWNSGGFGNVVIIDHGYGLESIYGHLSKILVPKGMNVKRGDLIGLSGSTGLSSGPHLHYQINRYGQPTPASNFFNNDITKDQFNEMIQAFESKSKFR
jgi:murein DD-endopeptidase MepM/ murein hydrolase activator NlpD